MTRTLKLRREVLTELEPEELAGVVGGATRPVLACAVAAAEIATALSLCVTCLWCTVPAGDTQER